MLEEFGKHLDPPRTKKGPYVAIGHIVKPEELAMTLGIPVNDLLLHYKVERDIQGLKRSYI